MKKSKKNTLRTEESHVKRTTIGLNVLNAVFILLVGVLMAHAPNKKEKKQQTAVVAEKEWVSIDSEGTEHRYLFHKNGRVEHTHGDINMSGNWEWVSINEMLIRPKEQYHRNRKVVVDKSDYYHIRFTKIDEKELVLAEGQLETEWESDFTKFQNYIQAGKQGEAVLAAGR